MEDESPHARRTRKDRVSVSVVPEESVDTTFRCPHLRLLFDERCEADGYTGKCDSCLDDGRDAQQMKNNDAIMGEVAAWLELEERGGNHETRRFQMNRFLATTALAAEELAVRIDDSDSAASYDPKSSDALLHLIAVDLLASCYTTLPGSSADNLPFYQQRTGPQILTALRLHSRYRFSPAAGHHARESSETPSWPGLYRGPSIEDRIAESVSQRRRQENLDSQASASSSMAISPPVGPDQGLIREVPNSSARPHRYPSFKSSLKNSIGWGDGPGSSGTPERSRANSSSSAGTKLGLLSMLASQPEFPKSSRSSSECSCGPEVDLLAMLACQPSAQKAGIPKKRPRKKNNWLQGHFAPKNNDRPDTRQRRKLTRRKHSPNTTSHLPQGLEQAPPGLGDVPPGLGDAPPGLELRRTQSAPRRPSDEAPRRPRPPLRRQSSTPALPTFRTVEIPEIRRISATTDECQEDFSPRDGRDSVSHVFGFGDDPTRLRTMGSWHFGSTTTIKRRLSPQLEEASEREYGLGVLGEGYPKRLPGWESEDETESEDSVDMLDKRRSQVFELQDFGDDPSWVREKRREEELEGDHGNLDFD